MASYSNVFTDLASRISANPMSTGTLPGAVRAGAKAGYFDPGAGRAAFKRRQLQRGSDRRRRQQILARLQGRDPMQMRQAALEAEQDTTGDLYDSLAGYDLADQDWFRSLLLPAEQLREQARARKAAERSGGLGVIGDLAGSVIGGLLPFSAGRSSSGRGATAGPAYRPTYREEEYRDPF